MRYKTLTSPTYYNQTAYYNEEYPNMKTSGNLIISDTSFSLNNNNSTAFKKATGEYIWR